MNYELWLSVLVVVSFGVIHFIEVASFLARVAGVENGDRALAYALQNAVFMATRFFSMLLLPVLGLLIDLQIEREHYLLIVVSALLSAFLFSLCAVLLRGRLVSYFKWSIGEVKKGRSLLGSIFKAPINFWRVEPCDVPLAGRLGSLVRDPICYFSAIIFSIYSLSVFVSFYFGLLFSDYRTSISQLSAITNAFAAVLLTFYVEPKISVAIDSDNKPIDKIFSLLMGRIIGVGLLSQVIVFFLW